MRIHTFTTFVATAVVLALATAAPAMTSSAPLPEPESQNGIRFLSGGIALEGRAAIERSVAKDYNLRLVFSAERGEYLSNVDVRIADAQGRTVLETVSKGPWLFVELPPGTYRVTANAAGDQLEKTVKVGARRHTEVRFAEWRMDDNARSSRPQAASR